MNTTCCRVVTVLSRDSRNREWWEHSCSGKVRYIYERKINERKVIEDNIFNSKNRRNKVYGYKFVIKDSLPIIEFFWDFWDKDWDYF